MKQQAKEYVISAVEYVSRLGKLGWCLVFLTLGSFILAMISQVQKKELYAPSWVWLVLLGVGLIVTPFIAFHHQRMDAVKAKAEFETRTASLEERLSDIEDKRPAVEVEPRKEHTRAGMRVTNTGQNAAMFSVRVVKLEAEGLRMIHAGRELQHIVPYDARWKEYPNKSEYALKGGDSYDIELFKASGEGGLEIYSANETHQGIILPDNDKEIKIVVKVFSEPKLKQPFERTYLLHFNQEGAWDRFEEVKP